MWHPFVFVQDLMEKKQQTCGHLELVLSGAVHVLLLSEKLADGLA
jgi:hypothetical protein